MSALKEIEPFSVFAEVELADMPEAHPGKCALPECTTQMNTRWRHQRFCSAACKKAHTNELRRVGHMIAEATLKWREHKYATDRNSPQYQLCRKARQYIARVQSAWLEDRRERQARAAQTLSKAEGELTHE